MSIKVKILNWNDIINAVELLTVKIKESNWIPDVIIAIARGGLIPAMLLSDFLDVRQILSIQLKHWPIPGQILEKVELVYPLPNVDLNNRKILIIDDIADTGDTLKFAKEYVENNYSCSVKTAALHIRKSRARYTPDYWSVEIIGDEWIVYPWNYIEDLANLIMKSIKKRNLKLFTINEILNYLRIDYGNEVLELAIRYLIHAINRLEELNFVKRDKEKDIEYFRIVK